MGCGVLFKCEVPGAEQMQLDHHRVNKIAHRGVAIIF
jgi:hypothetical protein